MFLVNFSRPFLYGAINKEFYLLLQIILILLNSVSQSPPEYFFGFPCSAVIMKGKI